MMLGSKLVVLAALLSAVAFAAPRTVFVESDIVVPEESLVQTSVQTNSAVAMLKTQFKALEVQLKSGAEVTPAVAKVIHEMITMVTNEIEPAIKEAHSSDQQEIDAKMKVVSDYNSAQTDKRNLLLSTGADIESDSQEHNAVALKWDQAAKAFLLAITHYEQTTQSKTDTCCDKQQAAVPATEYTPAFAKCDYTAADASGCTDRAEAAAATAVQSAFESGLKRYNNLDSGCTSETTRLASAKSDMDGKNQHCDDQEADARARKTLLDTQIAQFDSDWSAAVTEYTGGVASAENDFTTSQNRVVADEKDRKDEWKSTQEIKCLLQNYESGGSFDEASQNTCKAKITSEHLVVNYPPIPARVVWTKPVFTPLTDWSSFATDCHKDENADEAADQHCTIVATPAAPVCDPSTPAPGQDGTGGPRWALSAAGKTFAT